MKNLKKEIAEIINIPVEKFENNQWKQIVDEIILPQMAGKYGSRFHINDTFMNFVANNADKLLRIDPYTGSVMLEIALQRIFRGAIEHEESEWFDTLPKEYELYSSRWNDEFFMTSGCKNFILNGLECCLKYEPLRDHAVAILFAIIDKGAKQPMDKINLYGDYFIDGQGLYERAQSLVEKNTSFEERFKHYATPQRWRYHKKWFAKNLRHFSWDAFFSATKPCYGNWLKRQKQKRKIKQELRSLSSSGF